MTPSEKYNKKVIGKIIAALEGDIINTDGTRTPLPSTPETFEVIDIQLFGSHKVYICNQWNSEGVPQLVPADFVKEFIPY